MILYEKWTNMKVNIQSEVCEDFMVVKMTNDGSEILRGECHHVTEEGKHTTWTTTDSTLPDFFPSNYLKMLYFVLKSLKLTAEEKYKNKE